MIITLDGPAGSGKSTIAQRLAKVLGIEYIDSGALYRTLTLFALRRFGTVQGLKGEVAQYFEAHPNALEVKFETHRQRIWLEGEEIKDQIRDLELTRQIRFVAGHPGCREVVNGLMKNLAQSYSVVVDGRDIGTVVFPESKNKFYLDAPSSVRAKRRALELGEPISGPGFERMVQEIEDRDRSDQQRPIAPLVCATDAKRLDTGEMGVEEVLAWISQRLV
ncbi:MAG: cytidylate kinase [Candidatus Lambdaproteobacteria bacterium RIFOXYC1_FULL_56_13]|nr:MAG: cytidylate kinase [Candidatus Lambdaproteobacteria bacterium RIFOXYC1_FULL_56_13]